MVYNNIFNLFSNYNTKKDNLFITNVHNNNNNNINSFINNENNIDYNRRSMCSDSDTENGYNENDLSNGTTGKENEIFNNNCNNGKKNINNCSICLEDILYDNDNNSVKTNLFHCNHNNLFHYSCAWSWIVSSHTMTNENEILTNCPLCRNVTSFYVPEQ